MNSKSSTFDVYLAIPLHQPNEDGTTASVYRFSHEFVAIATDNSQYAELSATTFSQCSGTNRIKLCRKGFSTTMDETLLCLTSLFHDYSIPALRNCLVDSVLLPEASQASYLADGLYHVISRTARLQVKNDTDGLPVSISTLQCQACLIRASCSSTLTFNHGDLVLTPDIDFCETRPEPFVASVKLTPSLAAVFNTLPPASADLNVYSFGEARREIVSSIQLELASLPHVKTMTHDDLRTVAQPIFCGPTLLYDNFSFHQPRSGRLHAYAYCFLTGMCIHDYFSFVFQHQFYALPASVATFLQSPTTVLPRHARPIPTHCS